MKRIISISLAILIMNQTAFSQKDSPNKTSEPQIRQYWFVMLMAGNNRSQDSTTAVKIQEAHLANIGRLYNEGKLKVAGPFGDDGKWIGLFILDCKTKEEAEKLVQTDPAVAAGRLTYEIHPWYTVPTGSFEPGKPKSPLF